jgi:hypothetical protein
MTRMMISLHALAPLVNSPFHTSLPLACSFCRRAALCYHYQSECYSEKKRAYSGCGGNVWVEVDDDLEMAEGGECLRVGERLREWVSAS